MAGLAGRSVSRSLSLVVWRLHRDASQHSSVSWPPSDGNWRIPVWVDGNFCLKFDSIVLLPRDAMHSAVFAVARCPSACPSVCLTHAGILSKRFNISSNCFHRRVYPTVKTPHTVLVFFRNKRYSNNPTGPPDVHRMQGMKKIAIFDQYFALSRKW